MTIHYEQEQSEHTSVEDENSPHITDELSLWINKDIQICIFRFFLFQCDIYSNREDVMQFCPISQQEKKKRFPNIPGSTPNFYINNGKRHQTYLNLVPVHV